MFYGFSAVRLSCTTRMANNEDHSEDSNLNGEDSFETVKQRLKDRSKVSSPPSLDSILGQIVLTGFSSCRKLFRRETYCLNKRCRHARSYRNRPLRSPNKPKNTKDSSIRYHSSSCFRNVMFS